MSRFVISRRMALRLITSVLLLSSITGHAQKTIVTGKVVDASTKEPLPYVNIYFKNSKIGTASNEQGVFKLESYYGTDSLIASSLGYERQAKRVKKDQTQVINFELRVSGVALDAVTVVADKKYKDPALELMKKVVQNKKANNREKLETYEYDVYNKLEFDMNNIDEKFKNRAVMKPFDFVFENVDSTSESKPFLPVFLTESVSRYYYQKTPKNSKEVIKATKVAGVRNESISQFMGDMYQSTNVYDNFVEAFGKFFVSPVSDFGTLSYKYYLTDSAIINRHKCYKVVFKPRRKGDLVFDGEMWIADTSYAVKQIQASILADANINWVEAFTVYHEYNEVDKEVWMLTKEKVVADLNVSENGVGFYGRKTTIYTDFIINKPKEPEFFSSFVNIEVLDGVNDYDETYWNEARPEKLSDNESKVYAMVDTIQQIRAFRTYIDVITLFVNGYYNTKYVDLGPYFTTFSFNLIEGPRFRVGGRTTANFSKKVELSGYLAYGTLDKRFKYQAAGRYFISDKPRQIVSLSARNDLEQLGQSANAWRTDNILSSLFRRSPNNLLNAFEEYKASYEIEYFTGFSNTIAFNRRDVWSVGLVTFEKYASDGSLINANRLSTSEVTFTTRFAYDEKYISNNLDRISVGTQYPIVQVRLGLGIKGALGSEYRYQRLALILEDRIPLNPFGYSDITFEVGKVWGTLPFPLLQIFPGNETFFYDEYAFNLMNFYEFVSDRWMTLFWTHHFRGIFLNRVPLVRKLKLREVATVRSAFGGLATKHQSQLIFPASLNSFTVPYVEGGVGVENILKIFRVDALWRISYLNHPKAVPFGLRVTFQFDF